MWKQLDTQCTCGSWYVIKLGGVFVCNNLECAAKRIVVEKRIKFEAKQHLIKGKTWSKKLHRYVTAQDVQSGRV